MPDRPTLTIAKVGPSATIQDAGRFGLLRFGVTPAGPMDQAAFAIANLALGNPQGAAAIEIGPGGIALGTDVALPLAFAGGAFRWTRDSQTLPVAARVMLRPGDTLEARAGASGTWCYLAVPGGCDVPDVLGSRATHVRSRLGGLHGRALVAGDRLPVAASHPEADDLAIDAAWLDLGDAPVRIVLGPQDDHFTVAALETLLTSRWILTATADRMAYKFSGPVLAHAGDFNIVSDGVALGAIQVAGDGQPLVLMADRQPTGGYPKIAHVAQADIGRLAQLRPGQACRFESVSPRTAHRARQTMESRIARNARRSTPLRGTPTADRLRQSNLIGGFTDGRD